jgi:hypothetical protein
MKRYPVDVHRSFLRMKLAWLLNIVILLQLFQPKQMAAGFFLAQTCQYGIAKFEIQVKVCGGIHINSILR